MNKLKEIIRKVLPVVLIILSVAYGLYNDYYLINNKIDDSAEISDVQQTGSDVNSGSKTKTELSNSKSNVAADGKNEDSNKPSTTGTATNNNGNKTNNTSGSGNNKPSTNNGGSGNNSGNSGSSGKKGHWETRTETIPAWDEQVLEKAGYWEQVLVSAAWTEEDTYCYAWGKQVIEYEVCNGCGARFRGGINEHLSGNYNCGGWHNEFIEEGEPYCKEYKTEYIYHDAVYNNIWHEPVYKTVHHPAETKTYQVWVED